MNRTFKGFYGLLIAGVLSLSLMAGCGGGGGGSSSTQQTTTESTTTATLQTGTVAVGSTEVGTTIMVSGDTSGQSILTVENASSKLTSAEVGQVMVFEASDSMPLGFAGKVQSVQTTNVNGTPTTTATFTPANITDVFQNLNLNLSNVATNPQLLAGVALQKGARAYTKSAPHLAGGVLGKIKRALELNLIAENTDTAVGVDFTGGIKASFWKVNDQWVGTDPGTPAPKVDIVFTGQVELENPNFSQANIIIENGKLVTHNLQLTGTLKRNIKASVAGNFEVNATDLSKLFSSPTDNFYNGNSEYNEISFDYKGSKIKVHGVQKDPSKIVLGAAIISAAGVVPTFGENQTGNVLKTIPVGMVVTFFMTADMKVEATLSLGYQWRDMDINAGMGFSYDDSLGLPVSLLTGQYQTPVPFWDTTTHLDQTEGASFDVSGSAVATLTAGVDGGIVITGLEISQATAEGGIRGSLAGQLSMPVGGSLSGCYSNASVTAGVRTLLDVAAGVELKTDFKSKWLKWFNTSLNAGYVYEFPMYPAEGVDWLAETTIWSAGDDTCHNPQFSATAGTALYNYSFDASASAYQPMVSSCTWDFGDGATATGVTATHTYSGPGSYTAKLTVLYSDGIQKTVSKTVTVAEVPALNPAFTVSFSGLQASFDASTSTPGTDITSYSWSFGDGATGTGITPSHTYAAYSETPWSVTLAVTDNYGRTASVSQNVSATCPSGQILQNGQCVTPTPSLPTGVSATAGNGQVTISWNAVSGATSYNIYWSTASGVTKTNGTKISNATSPYIHTGRTNGTTYYYVVTAENGYGESTESSQVGATPQATTAATGRMPDTNQTTSYTNTFGEDHDYTINPPSYTDNGNGTVTDNVTGLMWQKQDDGTTRTWADAGAYCDASTLGGYSDWRLPSQIELISIIDNGVYNPSINTTFFPGTSSSDYWSSTTNAYFPSVAWNVNFYYGRYSNFDYKTDSNYVRCVRGGQTTPSLTDNGNGTVTDSGTLLTWQQGENSAMTWEAALSYCEGLSLAAQTDWRLPNHKELLSLVDYTRYNPSINTAFFPGTSSSGYWSSTTYANITSYAWIVDFFYGYSSGYDKAFSNYVRCVRGGQ